MNYPFNVEQLHFLKMFSKELPEVEWENVRKILADYFANKSIAAANNAWNERGWDETKVDELLKTHLRTPYNPENQLG